MAIGAMAMMAMMAVSALASKSGGGGGGSSTSITQGNTQTQNMQFNPTLLNQMGGTTTLKPLVSTTAPTDNNPETVSSAVTKPPDDQRSGVSGSVDLPSTDTTPDTYAVDLTSKGIKQYQEYIPIAVAIIAAIIIGYVVLKGGRKLKRGK